MDNPNPKPATIHTAARRACAASDRCQAALRRIKARQRHRRNQKALDRACGAPTN